MKERQSNRAIEECGATPEQVERLSALYLELGQPPISNKSWELAGHFLREAYDRYGSELSEEYKEYHNDRHAIDVLERSWRLWKLLQEVMPDRCDDRGYELLLLGATGHDVVFEAGERSGVNETESAEYVASYMREYRYGDIDMERVYDAIMATAVTIDASSGSISQHNLMSGSHDILKLVVAVADINGVALEGLERLKKDALNIHAEVAKNKLSIEGAVKMLQFQEPFLKSRIKEFQEALEWYCSPDEVAIINELIERNFSDSVKASLRYAKELAVNRQLAVSAVRSVLGIPAHVTIRRLKRLRNKSDKPNRDNE